MKRFVKEFAHHLAEYDRNSAMTRPRKIFRKAERDAIVRYYEQGQFSEVEAVGLLLDLNRGAVQPKVSYRYVIPVRYPDSEEPDLIDLVEFSLKVSVFRGLQGLYEEILQAYHDRIANQDRMSAIENAFHVVAHKYDGSWRYMEQDRTCLEVI